MGGNGTSGSSGINRREFIHSVGAAGLGFMLTHSALGQAVGGAGAADELKVAIIGVGNQGYNLLTEALKVPGLRFAAVCDIWPYSQQKGSGLLRNRGQTAAVYSDYREMLDKEQGLDAVIVATPDWMHAEQTNACLEAGAHVYCEKEMSNTLEGARSMVQTARRTGKLLQIGHQRRSNPRYLHGVKLIEKDRLLGRITTINGQWNRSTSESGDIGWARSVEMDAATLKQFGYEDMYQFRNWRWFRKYAGGPIVDLGSHQIDVYNWFLKARPKSVMASGGADYYPNRQWYDNVMAVYEYDTETGPVRAFYQVLNTSSHGGFWEAFMGDQGTLVISENTNVGFVFREVVAAPRDWEAEAQTVAAMGREGAIELRVGETLDPSGRQTAEAQAMEAQAKKPPHLLHLENFFDAIRTGSALSCPPEVGYETAVTVLKVNEAIAAGRRLEFAPGEFQV